MHQRRLRRQRENDEIKNGRQTVATKNERSFSICRYLHTRERMRKVNRSLGKEKPTTRPICRISCAGSALPQKPLRKRARNSTCLLSGPARWPPKTSPFSSVSFQ